MPIVFICSVPFGGGERLAKSLAQKLGYSYLSREDVVAKANECGIPVGKLEVAMVKKPAVQERLARLKERYHAVATATICEKAAQENLVYYGRAGHLLLPGIAHVLRVRLIPEHGQRVENVMRRIRLSREKAEKFLQDIDSDIRVWVHFVHGVDMDDLRKYDFVINLEKMSVENAATALCGIVELPDYRPTPASMRAMEDRLLQSRARIRLALDPRMAEADLTVRASDQVVTITYMPRQAQLARVIPEVLGDLPGCREIRCTLASTNILWVQERFRPDSETFRQMNELARRWGAAVELLRYRPAGLAEEGEAGEARFEAAAGRPPAYTGGIEDDVVEKTSAEDGAFRETLEALVREGRSGGGQTVSGSRERLLAALNPDISYSLVAVGDLFLDKPAAARTRLTRDVSNFLASQVKTPVIPAADLVEKLRFGPKQFLATGAALVLVVAIYGFLFTHQEGVLNFLTGDFHTDHRWVAPAVIAVAAPLVAALYGNVAGALLKLLRLE